MLPTAAKLSAGKDKSRAAASLQVFRYYDRPSVCNVGLSTAVVTCQAIVGLERR
jgi:hypothetical protein